MKCRLINYLVFLPSLILLSLVELRAEGSTDPFVPYLDGKAPEILREVAITNVTTENVILKGVVFRSRDESEIFAVIAKPMTPGKHPGILVLHGGGGSAEVDKAVSWAQRGYVAVAPDLPGIADPKKLTETKGKWSAMKYGEGRWVAAPDASASIIFDAVLSAMKSLYLLRAQADVDTSRIGVVGVSWGGYMTTMVCGLAGDQVKAGFAIYGCGFFDLGEYGQEKKGAYNPQFPRNSLGRMPPEERDRWFKYLDAGRRTPNIKAAFFLAAATNDFFGYLRAAQATLDSIRSEKNHVYAPNSNHKIPLPGGSVFEKKTDEHFTPTTFQPFPTPNGKSANWLAMEVPYFDYYLKGVGEAFPQVHLLKNGDQRLPRFSVTAPHTLAGVQVCWAKADPDPRKRLWISIPAVKTTGDVYEAKLPEEAADWFALVSDDRPVTVSSDIVGISAPQNSGSATAP